MSPRNSAARARLPRGVTQRADDQLTLDGLQIDRTSAEIDADLTGPDRGLGVGSPVRPRCSGVMVSLECSSTTRSMTWRNSRTFPGQAYSTSACRAAGGAGPGRARSAPAWPGGRPRPRARCPRRGHAAVEGSPSGPEDGRADRPGRCPRGPPPPDRGSPRQSGRRRGGGRGRPAGGRPHPRAP